MSTNTPNLQLVKPDPTDTVNVVTQINDNYDTIDEHVGDLEATYPTPKPVIRVHQATTQTLANVTFTAINMDAETEDSPLNWHSTTVNNSRITPQIAGEYEVIGYYSCAVNNTGDRAAQIRKNGSSTGASPRTPYAAVPSPKSNQVAGGVMCFGYVEMNGTTDYVELMGFQDSGGNLDTFANADGTRSWMQMEFVRPLTS